MTAHCDGLVIPDLFMNAEHSYRARHLRSAVPNVRRNDGEPYLSLGMPDRRAVNMKTDACIRDAVVDCCMGKRFTGRIDARALPHRASLKSVCFHRG